MQNRWNMQLFSRLIFYFRLVFLFGDFKCERKFTLKLRYSYYNVIFWKLLKAVISEETAVRIRDICRKWEQSKFNQYNTSLLIETAETESGPVTRSQNRLPRNVVQKAIHYRPLSYMTVHFHTCPSTFIHDRPLSYMTVHFHAHWTIIVDVLEVLIFNR